ncbi:unnamed protein product [Parnassius apollo]|uniref:(apollo) hypothetical protein n=1 Tax=Parnassius apollo TaxID=110799 RepID=A0A8S3XPJ9_PARAO|nr:unnamed protein product [Parnassius apollo]
MCLEYSAYNAEMRSLWCCPECLNAAPKATKHDNTPVRNVSTRGCKRTTPNSPPISSENIVMSKEIIREVVQDIIKESTSNIVSKMQESIINILNNELKPVRDELLQIIRSFKNLKLIYHPLFRIYSSLALLLQHMRDNVLNMKKKPKHYLEFTIIMVMILVAKKPEEFSHLSHG